MSEYSKERTSISDVELEPMTWYAMNWPRFIQRIRTNTIPAWGITWKQKLTYAWLYAQHLRLWPGQKFWRLSSFLFPKAWVVYNISRAFGYEGFWGDHAEYHLCAEIYSNKTVQVLGMGDYWYVVTVHTRRSERIWKCPFCNEALVAETEED